MKEHKIKSIKNVFLSVASDTIHVHQPVASDQSISLSWMNPYPDCANVEYEYQLYRESDAKLVRSGISMNSELTLSELECNTRYRLRLRDKMAITGADSWIIVQTNTLGEYMSSHSVLLCDSEVHIVN